MKRTIKLFAGIAAAAIAAAGIAALAGCSNNKVAGGAGGNPMQTGTAEEAYGFSAATAGMIISNMGGAAGGATGTAGARTARTAEKAAQVTDEATIATLNEYMLLVESLLAQGDFDIVSGINDGAQFAEYQYTMTATYYDINGEKLQYVTYYNQTLTGSYTERDDDWWEDEEVTDVYSVDGVMLVDGTAYEMSGRFVNETEGRESESTQTFRVELDAAAGDYLMVTQESEDEGDESENEYAYSLYRGGRLAERTTFEYESERGETEIKMTLVDRVNGINQMFEFEKETERGQEIIKIKVGGQGGGEYIVRIETDASGNSQYVYYSGNDRVWRGERWD